MTHEDVFCLVGFHLIIEVNDPVQPINTLFTYLFNERTEEIFSEILFFHLKMFAREDDEVYDWSHVRQKTLSGMTFNEATEQT